MVKDTEKVSSSTSHQSYDHKQPEKSQAQGSSEFRTNPHVDFPMNPVYYPLQYEEQVMNRGAGIYAVPVHTFAGHVAGLASNNLIPLTYNLPTYQTGALRPFVRWLSRVMRRAATPPRPQRHVVNGDNDQAAAARPLVDDAVPEGQGREENGAENRAIANENENVVGPEAGNQWWGILKEIQIIVFGFITSLFPGFQNID